MASLTFLVQKKAPRAIALVETISFYVKQHC